MAFGPIDLVVLEFKCDVLDDEIITNVADLVAHEVIRILDLVIVQKDEQGEIMVQELQDLPPGDLHTLEILRAEISGMITADDIKMIGRKIRKNTLAAIMLFENLWTIRLRQDISDGGGRLVMHERIPSEVVADAIKDLAEYD